MRLRNVLQASGLTALTVALAPRVAVACAVCGLGPNDVGGHAFNSSVLFMIAAPYLTFAVVGGAMFWAYRAHRKQNSSHLEVQKLQGSPLGRETL